MDLPDGITLHLQWQTGNPVIEEKAMALWKELNALSDDTDPKVRAKQLVYCALNEDGKVVSVTTAQKAICPFIELPMLFVRYLVHPDYRLHRIGEQIYIETVDFLMSQSVDGEYMGCKGIAARVVNRSVQNHYTRAVLKNTQTTFIGYDNRGDRLRIRYFEGARA